MSEEGRVEAPERIWFAVENIQDLAASVAVVPFRAPPQRNAVEYIRAQPSTADAEMVAKEVVARWKRDIGQVVKYERMEADIAAALSAAKQQGRDERDESLQRMLRAAAEEEVNLHVSSGLLKAISIIRSNQ